VKFYKLDRLGLALGGKNLGNKEDYFHFLDMIIDYDAMGGYVIVSKSLIPFLEDHLYDVLDKSRDYMLKGDVWHLCDNMSERSVGQALVDYFPETLPWMDSFLSSGERWLMRSAGVAIHFFTKRIRDDPESIRRLLELVEPYLEVRQEDAVKGIGWGLKTVGRYYPELLKPFLKDQRRSGKKISKLMWSKALNYLEEEKRAEIMNLEN
jgi:3-methyladenine DNA glycosylase AlkD